MNLVEVVLKCLLVISILKKNCVKFIECRVIFVFVEFIFKVGMCNVEYLFVVLEVLVNCVEGWEVIFNYFSVIVIIVDLMVGVFY